MLTVVAGEFTLRQFWTTRQNPTFRTVAVERLEQGPVDVIFVGSSHIYTGVDPSCFPYSVVNLSDSALNYQMAEILCRKYWRRLCKAKLVVLELDAVPVYEDTLSRRDGDYRGFLEWNVQATELPLPIWEKLKAGVLEQFTSTRINRIWPYLVESTTKPKRPPGPGFNVPRGKIDLQNNEASMLALGTTYTGPIVEKNLQCLRRLLIDLHQAGVKVKMLRPPFHIAYWQHPKGAGRDQAAERARKIFLEMPSNSQTDIIDLRYLLQSEDECFRDLVHVSACGSKKLSKRLAQIIDLEEM